MLQQDKPDDYVLATGKTSTVRDFCELAFDYLGMNYEDYVQIDPRYYRPAEVDVLQGDAEKAKRILDWEPKTRLPELVKIMVDAELQSALVSIWIGGLMKIKKMTQKSLQKKFDDLNGLFFAGSLRGIEVRFSKVCGDRDGSFNLFTKRILISSGFKNSSVMCSIVLLHEMAHANLNLQGYIGYPEDAGHGGLFHVELDRLYKIGAYDGLL